MRAVLAMVLLVGCGSASAAHPEPLAWVELRTGGAGEGDELPLIVAMHGRGDTADRFARVFDGLATPARIALLRAPIHERDGDAWFTFRRPHTWRHVAEDLDALSDRVVATLDAITRDRPTRGRPIAVGFSQGAMLVYVLAIRHPDRIAAGISLSGVFVEETLAHDRVDPARTPPLVALHGTHDEVIPLDGERDSIEMLRARGVDVELREHDAPHWVNDEMRADLHAELARRLAAEPR